MGERSRRSHVAAASAHRSGRVAADPLVLRLGQRAPAVGVGRDRRGLGRGAPRGGQQLPRAGEPVSERVGVPTGAGERGQLRLCAESLGAELDADLRASPVPCEAALP